MIKLDKLSFWYNWINFFEDLSLELSKWEILLILWFSWSWKTTLINVIWSFIKPISWNIFYNNSSIFDMDNKNLYFYRSNIIWFSFQDIRLIENISVYDNLIIANLLFNYPIDKDLLNELINEFNLWNILNSKVSDISWWEKERLSIAKAYANKPEIVILDEPCTYLNEELKEKIYSFIKYKSKSIITIVVTHDWKLIDYFNLSSYKENKNLKFYK